MAYAPDGNQLSQFKIKWVKDVQKVLRGSMRITAAAAQHELIQQLYRGQVLTQYNNSIKIAHKTAKIACTRALVAVMLHQPATATAPAKTQADFVVRQAKAQVANKAVDADPAMVTMMKPALQSTMKMVCPYKALEKKKCFMRRKMRKPADMKIRIFVNQLHRISFDELPQLPPFACGPCGTVS
jgi:hypothetical protein